MCLGAGRGKIERCSRRLINSRSTVRLCCYNLIECLETSKRSVCVWEGIIRPHVNAFYFWRNVSPLDPCKNKSCVAEGHCLHAKSTICQMFSLFKICTC